MSDVISVARTLDRCGVLGPGIRAVLWVQGCPLRCGGCVAAETLPFEGGTAHGVRELAEWITGVGGIDGLTLSGGEPFSQAAALVRLVDLVREGRPGFSVMAYSGFRLEALRRGDDDQRALLERLDLLVDGPYVAARHASLLWRGSANQRIVALSGRHPELADATDSSAGIEITAEPDGSMSWAGVPPAAGFREHFEERLAARGFSLRHGDDDTAA
ncbi:radical SAM protein [Streptomyces sp. A7024]|uniref:Radical SAM protein n=1 Tax=Streptomyces coryli TaxID=1128680 RepID=A0A6G4U6Y6_9ACTN|nr:4Fe-4S single cluster domain-containing protein [Streptomyces coryli]NGN68005.1 radical SAM protein [Streptomyces coryli]